jgi:dTDP-glucose 4,6-dehydratase
MKLFITGGAGFIGSNFIHYWLANHPEDQIVNFDTLTYAGNLENLKAIESNPNYTFVKGDICDFDAVKKAMEGADWVVHYAAESHNDRAILDPGIFIRSNVLGTQTLLQAAKELNVKRFHHVSTDEVLGSLESHEPAWTESSPYAPRSPYAASKAASDHIVRAYHLTYGLPITISNCTNNYGPYHFPEKIIPLFITNLLEGKKVPVYGDGQQIRDWIHTEDHARGIEAVLLKGVPGETYFFGAEVQTTNLDLTQKLLTLLGKDESSIEHVNDRPGHDRRYDLNCTKAHTELGWKPQISLDEGLKQTVAWYQSHEDWWRSCKSGEYQKYYEANYTNR